MSTHGCVVFRWHNASQPFRRLLLRHHPLSTARAATALPRHRPRSSRAPAPDVGGFYLGHAPSPQHFEHLADEPGTGDQPGCYGDSCVSYALYASSLVASGCYPAGSLFETGSMSDRQAGIVSASRGSDFRGQNLEAPPLPMNQDRSPYARSLLARTYYLGIDSRSTHRQALSGLSWLSYSRPLTYSGPRACQARHPVSLPRWLPTPADVERSLWETNPVDWICKPVAHAPALRRNGSLSERARMSASPTFS